MHVYLHTLHTTSIKHETEHVVDGIKEKVVVELTIHSFSISTVYNFAGCMQCETPFPFFTYFYLQNNSGT